MAEISAAELAKRFKVDKTKVSRAIKSGALTKRNNPNGKGYLIDVSEAQRWVDSLAQRSTQPQVQPPAPPVETTVEIAKLEAEVKALREMVEVLKEDKEDWKNQAQTLLLSDQRSKRGLFARLFGNGDAA